MSEEELESEEEERQRKKEIKKEMKKESSVKKEITKESSIKKEMTKESATKKEVQNKSPTKQKVKKESSHSLNEKETSGGKEYLCHICARVYYTRKSLSRHVRKHELAKNRVPEIWVCEYCGKRLKGQRLLRYHCQSQHNTLPPKHTHTCHICGLTTKNSGVYHLHMIMHSRVPNYGKRNLKCGVCSKIFSQRKYLTNHMRTHNKELWNELCPLCNKRFHKSKLLSHMIAKHSPRPGVLCGVCGNLYSTTEQLERHKLLRCNKKHGIPNHPVKYNTSKYQLPSNSKHSVPRKWTREKKNHCTACVSFFYNKEHFDHHMKTVHGENDSKETFQNEGRTPIVSYDHTYSVSVLFAQIEHLVDHNYYNYMFFQSLESSGNDGRVESEPYLSTVTNHVVESSLCNVDRVSHGDYCLESTNGNNGDKIPLPAEVFQNYRNRAPQKPVPYKPLSCHSYCNNNKNGNQSRTLLRTPLSLPRISGCQVISVPCNRVSGVQEMNGPENMTLDMQATSENFNAPHETESLSDCRENMTSLGNRSSCGKNRSSLGNRSSCGEIRADVEQQEIKTEVIMRLLEEDENMGMEFQEIKSEDSVWHPGENSVVVIEQTACMGVEIKTEPSEEQECFQSADISSDGDSCSESPVLDSASSELSGEPSANCLESAQDNILEARENGNMNDLDISIEMSEPQIHSSEIIGESVVTMGEDDIERETENIVEIGANSGDTFKDKSGKETELSHFEQEILDCLLDSDDKSSAHPSIVPPDMRNVINIVPIETDMEANDGEIATEKSFENGQISHRLCNAPARGLETSRNKIVVFYPRDGNLAIRDENSQKFVSFHTFGSFVDHMSLFHGMTIKPSSVLAKCPKCRSLCLIRDLPIHKVVCKSVGASETTGPCYLCHSCDSNDRVMEEPSLLKENDSLTQETNVTDDQTEQTRSLPSLAKHNYHFCVKEEDSTVLINQEDSITMETNITNQNDCQQLPNCLVFNTYGPYADHMTLFHGSLSLCAKAKCPRCRSVFRIREVKIHQHVCESLVGLGTTNGRYLCHSCTTDG